MKLNYWNSLDQESQDWAATWLVQEGNHRSPKRIPKEYSPCKFYFLARNGCSWGESCEYSHASIFACPPWTRVMANSQIWKGKYGERTMMGGIIQRTAPRRMEWFTEGNEESGNLSYALSDGHHHRDMPAAGLRRKPSWRSQKEVVLPESADAPWAAQQKRREESRQHGPAEYDAKDSEYDPAETRPRRFDRKRHKGIMR